MYKIAGSQAGAEAGAGAGAGRGAGAGGHVTGAAVPTVLTFLQKKSEELELVVAIQDNHYTV